MRPRSAASRVGRPSRRSCSAKVTSRIELATAMPIAMMAPMNDCTLSVVPVASSISTTPHSTAGIVSITASARRTDWKFAASSRKIASDRQQQADAQSGERLFERRDLAAQPDA